MLEKERQRKKETLIQPGFGESKPSKLSKVTAKPLKGWSVPGKRTKKTISKLLNKNKIICFAKNLNIFILLLLFSTFSH
jgi:hypothetical protein